VIIAQEGGISPFVASDSDDRRTPLLVEGDVASGLPKTSAFRSLEQASDFFERGSLGYSVTTRPGEFDGLELRGFNWQVSPLAVEKVESSFFGDPALFPAGTVAFDSALLMRGIDHEWHGREPLCGMASGGRPGKTYRVSARGSAGPAASTASARPGRCG
jgi:hypothetical protein